MAISAVVCVTCPVAMPDVGMPGTIWDEAVGAVIVARAGCLVKVR